MITWVTVWVLTVFTGSNYYGYYRPSNYQLEYAKQETCLRERGKKRKEGAYAARCDFKQVPMVIK